MREIGFQLTQPLALFLNQLAFGHIHGGADVLNEIAGLIDKRVPDHVHMLQRPVGQ